MTVILLTEYNTRCYGVIFEKIGWIKVQKFEGISNDENKIYCLKPFLTFLGKSEVCEMTIILTNRYLKETLFYSKWVKKMVEIGMYVLVGI